MNLINAKYGNDPGLKAYTHVSDQFSLFATQDIPATVSEAPYILDGLLMIPTGKKIREQYADTGGFTDNVFAVTSLLAYPPPIQRAASITASQPGPYSRNLRQNQQWRMTRSISNRSTVRVRVPEASAHPEPAWRGLMPSGNCIKENNSWRS